MMINLLTYLVTFSSVALAVPFKRYDNGTTSPGSVIDSPDQTVTIDKYITTTLSPSSFAILSASPWVSDLGLVTSTVTQYVTSTIDGQPTVSAVSTYTTTVVEPTTTSTLTNYVTITENNGSIITEALASIEDVNSCVCQPSVVTVTVSESAADYTTWTQTSVTSYPIVGEFSVGGTTTTLTSYVELTVTETSITPLATSAFSRFSNGTEAKLRRSFYM